MPAGRGVARLDRLDARLDEPLEQTTDLIVEKGILEGSRRLGSNQSQELLAPRIEGDDLLVDILFCQEPLGGVLLLVDKLNDADDFVSLGDERRDEHGLRAVTSKLVEAAIEREERPGG